MHQLARADRCASQLRATIRDHFVRVCVRARAGTGLENVEREMVVQFSIDDFLGRLHNQRAALGVEQSEIVIGLRSRPFNQSERANEGP